MALPILPILLIGALGFAAASAGGSSSRRRGSAGPQNLYRFSTAEAVMSTDTSTPPVLTLLVGGFGTDAARTMHNALVQVAQANPDMVFVEMTGDVFAAAMNQLDPSLGLENMVQGQDTAGFGFRGSNGVMDLVGNAENEGRLIMFDDVDPTPAEAVAAIETVMQNAMAADMAWEANNAPGPMPNEIPPGYDPNDPNTWGDLPAGFDPNDPSTWGLPIPGGM